MTYPLPSFNNETMCPLLYLDPGCPSIALMPLKINLNATSEIFALNTDEYKINHIDIEQHVKLTDLFLAKLVTQDNLLFAQFENLQDVIHPYNGNMQFEHKYENIKDIPSVNIPDDFADYQFYHHSCEWMHGIIYC